jgi:hypothetical protein
MHRIRGTRRFLSQRPWLLLTAIVCLGAALRWYNLSEWDMWLDEVDTLWIAESGVFTEGPMYSTAPVNFWLTAASVRLLGPDELGERFPSFLAGVLTLLVFFLTFRGTIGDRAALLGTLFLCLSMWHVFWSQVGRHFAPQVLFVLLAIFCLLKFREGRSPLFAWSGAGAMALALLTHSSAFFFLAAIVTVLTLGWISGQSDKTEQSPVDYRRAALPFLGLLLAYLPVMFVVGRYVMENKVAWNPPYGIIASYLFYLSPVFLFFALAGFLVLLRRAGDVAWLLVGLIAIPMALLLISTTLTLSSVPYILASLLPVSAFIGVALDEMLNWGDRSRCRTAAIAVVVGIFMAQSWDLAHYYLVYNGLKPRWKEAAAYVAERRDVGEPVYAAEGIVAEFYLGRGRAGWLGWDEVNAAPEPGAWYIEYLSFGPMPDDPNPRYSELMEKVNVEAIFPLHYGAKNRTLVVMHGPAAGTRVRRSPVPQSAGS